MSRKLAITRPSLRTAPTIPIHLPNRPPEFDAFALRVTQRVLKNKTIASLVSFYNALIPALKRAGASPFPSLGTATAGIDAYEIVETYVRGTVNNFIKGKLNVPTVVIRTGCISMTFTELFFHTEMLAELLLRLVDYLNFLNAQVIKKAPVTITIPSFLRTMEQNMAQMIDGLSQNEKHGWYKNAQGEYDGQATSVFTSAMCSMYLVRCINNWALQFQATQIIDKSIDAIFGPGLEKYMYSYLCNSIKFLGFKKGSEDPYNIMSAKVLGNPFIDPSADLMAIYNYATKPGMILNKPPPDECTDTMIHDLQVIIDSASIILQDSVVLTTFSRAFAVRGKVSAAFASFVATDPTEADVAQAATDETAATAEYGRITPHVTAVGIALANIDNQMKNLMAATKSSQQQAAIAAIKQEASNADDAAKKANILSTGVASFASTAKQAADQAKIKALTAAQIGATNAATQQTNAVKAARSADNAQKAARDAADLAQTAREKADEAHNKYTDAVAHAADNPAGPPAITPKYADSWAKNDIIATGIQTYMNRIIDDLTISRDRIGQYGMSVGKFDTLIDELRKWNDAPHDIADAKKWFMTVSPYIRDAEDEFAPVQQSKKQTAGSSYVLRPAWDLNRTHIELEYMTSVIKDIANTDKGALDIQYGDILDLLVREMRIFVDELHAVIVSVFLHRACAYLAAQSKTHSVSDIMIGETLAGMIGPSIESYYSSIMGITSAIAIRVAHLLNIRDHAKYADIIGSLAQYNSLYGKLVTTGVRDIITPQGDINQTYDPIFANAVADIGSTKTKQAIDNLHAALNKTRKPLETPDALHYICPAIGGTEVDFEQNMVIAFSNHWFSSLPTATKYHAEIQKGVAALAGRVSLPAISNIKALIQTATAGNTNTLSEVTTKGVRDAVRGIYDTILAERDLWTILTKHMSAALMIHMAGLKLPPPINAYRAPQGPATIFNQEMGRFGEWIADYDKQAAAADKEYKALSAHIAVVDAAITTAAVKVDDTPIKTFQNIVPPDYDTVRATLDDAAIYSNAIDDLHKLRALSIDLVVKIWNNVMHAADSDAKVNDMLSALFKSNPVPITPFDNTVRGYIANDPQKIFDDANANITSIPPPTSVIDEAINIVVKGNLDTKVFDALRKKVSDAEDALWKELSKYKKLPQTTTRADVHGFLDGPIRRAFDNMNTEASAFWRTLLDAIRPNKKQFQFVIKMLLETAIRKNVYAAIPGRYIDELRSIGLPEAIISVEEEEFESDYEQMMRLERERLLAPRAGPSDEELAYRLQMEEAQRASLATQSYAKYMEEMERRMQEESAAKEAAREFIAAVPPHHDDVVRHEINVIRRESDNDADYFDKLAKIADVVARDAGESFAPAIELPALAAQVNKLLDKLGIPKYAEHEYNPLLRIALLKNIGKNKRLRELLGIEDKDVS